SCFILTSAIVRYHSCIVKMQIPCSARFYFVPLPRNSSINLTPFTNGNCRYCLPDKSFFLRSSCDPRHARNISQIPEYAAASGCCHDAGLCNSGAGPKNNAQCNAAVLKQNLHAIRRLPGAAQNIQAPG